MKATRSIQLLVVEDSEISRMLIESLFAEYPAFHIVSVPTGKEALKFVKKNLPDLVLLDLILPDMDGFAVLQHIKQHPRTAQLPVVVVSSKSREEDIQRAIALGAQNYIVKPIGVNNLTTKVVAICEDIFEL